MEREDNEMKPLTNEMFVKKLQELAGTLPPAHKKLAELMLQMYYELITEDANLDAQIREVEKRLSVGRDPEIEYMAFETFNTVAGALDTKTIDAILEDLEGLTGPEIEACRQALSIRQQGRNPLDFKRKETQLLPF